MKFVKQNLLTILVIIMLIVSLYQLNDLQEKYDELSSQCFSINSNINNIASKVNSNKQPTNTEKAVKEVMTPLDLAEYMGIEMDLVYELATRDNTMPYVMVNGEYRFNKAAIDKWMETRKTIDVR